MKLEIVEEILLETLSFYEWQNTEKTLISLNSKDLILIESITLDEMNIAINGLIRKGMLEKKIEKKELFYRRVNKRPSLIRKIYNKILSLKK